MSDPASRSMTEAWIQYTHLDKLYGCLPPEGYAEVTARFDADARSAAQRLPGDRGTRRVTAALARAAHAVAQAIDGLEPEPVDDPDDPDYDEPDCCCDEPDCCCDDPSCPVHGDEAAPL